jgi:hypothetical protein
MTFTKVLSDEQAMASQQLKSSLDADGTLAELRRDVQMIASKIFPPLLPPPMLLRILMH